MKKNSKSKHRRILIANGVNLDLLGQREPEIYGSMSLAAYEKDLNAYGKELIRSELYSGFELEFFQTNSEVELLVKLSETWDGCVLNPGAWTHTSLALADRLKALELKFVEVHISNTFARESIRHNSLTAVHAAGVVIGVGPSAYRIGLVALLEALSRS
jgi:3-dehydroquinate dehydratase-2